jgi:GNAT superfamily N-acetyltransferase
VSSELDIRPLDASDPSALAAWHRTYYDAHVFGLAHSTPRMLEEMRALLLADSPGERREPFAGYVDGDPVVVGMLELPLMDNLATVQVEVATRPESRRRGFGAAMLEHLTSLARRHGRHTLQSEASWGYDAPPDGAGTPGAEFLTASGFDFALVDVKRVLHLPVHGALLDRLDREAAAYAAGYSLRYFQGPVPEDILEGYGALIGSLMDEAPKGELEIEAEVYDAARIRADEQVLEAAGRRRHATVAVSASGDLVAYSELAVPRHDPVRAFQWGTLVRPDHRGHRLGLATKVHNLRRFQAAEPGRTEVVTWNAEVNRHMVAVNEAMGFRPVGRLGEFQKRL